MARAERPAPRAQSPAPRAESRAPAPSALVLTAGLGTRLDPITRLRAKPAVPLGGSTLVEHVLAWLARESVRHVVLNLHFRPATIAAVVGDGSHLGLSVRYSWEQPLLGSAGGPRRALPLLESDPILIVNGDTLCEVALGPMIDQHRASGADVTMALVPNPAPSLYGGLMLDDTGAVVDVVPRGRADGSWHFVGVQLARRGMFERLDDGVPAETVSGIYRTHMAAHPGRIRAHTVDAAFFDIGTPEDYLETALRLQARDHSPASHLPGLTPHDSIVWPDAVVDPGAVLERCIVAGDVRVPDGFRTRDRIIVPAGVVGPGDRAEVIDGMALFPLSTGSR